MDLPTCWPPDQHLRLSKSPGCYEVLHGRSRVARVSSMKVYFDGGCRPNPGCMETAVVIAGECHLEPDVGFGTNNDAEWLAAINALRVAATLRLTDVQLLGDSALVVNQANGVSACRTPDLAAHLAAFHLLRASFARVRVRRISRSQNLAGIYLAKLHSGR